MERGERLLEPAAGLAGDRAAERPAAGLAAVRNGLLPDFAAHGVMGEPVDVLLQPGRVQLLDGLHDAGVEHSSPIL